nr:phosphoribosylglycinamide formyltransferase [Nitrospiraceae bacterium]
LVCDRENAPVLEKAREAGIPALQILPKAFSSKDEYERRILSHLREKKVEAIALAGYMRLVGPSLIEAYPDRIVNIHPSLLPAFPGLHAQKQAIDYGVRVTGVTVHFVDLQMDHGPVILQKCLSVSPEDTEESLVERLLPLEHETYIEALDGLSRGLLKISGRRVVWRPD